MSHRPEPPRLASGTDDDPVLRRIGALTRAASDHGPLGRDALERVRTRLSQKPGPIVFGMPLRALAVGVATVGLAGVAVAGFALSSGSRPKPVPVQPAPTVAPPVPERVVPAVKAAPPASVAPVEEAVPAPRAVAHQAPAAAPSASAGRLAQESAALEAALTALRRDRDPARALALLDHHAASFPDGVLVLEARVARIDANLALGRNAEALALLERLPLERVGRGVELRLVRAELRATSDPKAALADFDAVLATGASKNLEERALHGRARCRASTGDRAGARADAERYLAKYPSGRFAQALGQLAAER